MRVASAVACTMRNRTNGVITVTDTPVVICGDAASAAYAMSVSCVDPSKLPSIVSVVDPVEFVNTYVSSSVV